MQQEQDCNWTEADILDYKISDEALEIAAATDAAKSANITILYSIVLLSGTLATRAALSV
jgi:hypothetical protein